MRPSSDRRNSGIRSNQNCSPLLRPGVSITQRKPYLLSKEILYGCDLQSGFAICGVSKRNFIAWPHRRISRKMLRPALRASADPSAVPLRWLSASHHLGLESVLLSPASNNTLLVKGVSPSNATDQLRWRMLPLLHDCLELVRRIRALSRRVLSDGVPRGIWTGGNEGGDGEAHLAHLRFACDAPSSFAAKQRAVFLASANPSDISLQKRQAAQRDGLWSGAGYRAGATTSRPAHS